MLSVSPLPAVLVRAQTTPNAPPQNAPASEQLREQATLASMGLLQKSVGMNGAFAAALDMESPNQTPEAKANRAIDALLEKAGLTVADLNQARARTAASAARAGSPPITLETIALDAIADAAFLRKDPALMVAGRRRGIDFSQSDFAALRTRQIGKTPLEMARLLVEAVAAAPSLSKDRRITEGVEARTVSRVARRRLTEADAKHSALTPERKLALPPLVGLYSEPRPTPPEKQGKVGRYDPARGIYYAPAPDRAPTLAPGQQFLCRSSASALRDSQTNQPVPKSRVALRVLTLQKIERLGEDDAGENLRLTFTLEGYPAPVIWSGSGGLYDIAGLSPIADDDTVRALRRAYLGKTIWSYGGFGVTAVTQDGSGASFGYNSDTPAVVAGIYRMREGEAHTLPLGSSPGYIGERQSSVTTRDTLIVALRLPPNARPTSSAFFSVRRSGPAEKDFGRPRVLAYYAAFADAWDFEREFTRIGLKELSRRWPAALRRAALSHRLAKGMTPEMAAFVSGWPNEFGTRAELIRRAATATAAIWEYDNAPPFHFCIYFRKGRVTHWGEDGHLP